MTRLRRYEHSSRISQRIVSVSPLPKMHRLDIQKVASKARRSSIAFRKHGFYERRYSASLTRESFKCSTLYSVVCRVSLMAKKFATMECRLSKVGSCRRREYQRERLAARK